MDDEEGSVEVELYRPEEAVSEFVGEECDEHGEAECGGPRRHRIELSLDGSVAVGLNDTGREICIRIRGHDQSF